MERLIHDAKSLPPVPRDSSDLYHKNKSTLLEHVNTSMESHDGIHELIGSGDLSVMFDNHRNHVNFMDTVFLLNNFELLARILPWVYRAYPARGFSYDYFPLALHAWIAAVREVIGERPGAPIVEIYRWIISRHGQLIALSGESEYAVPPFGIDPETEARLSNFISLLVRGDHRECLAIAISMVDAPADVEKLYLCLLQPAMSRIGQLWETNKISVAQEHLASSIITRIMAVVFSGIGRSEKRMGRAVIAASPNEYHEIGAWMVSDILEMNGWEVRYLGANVPPDELEPLLVSFRPHILALSVTMPFNLSRASDIIAGVRKNEALKHIKIMVGGTTFNALPGLYKTIGADGYAADARQALQLAAEWFEDIRE